MNTPWGVVSSKFIAPTHSHAKRVYGPHIGKTFRNALQRIRYEKLVLQELEDQVKDEKESLDFLEEYRDMVYIHVRNPYDIVLEKYEMYKKLYQRQLERVNDLLDILSIYV